jgi:hypothetical protein
VARAMRKLRELCLGLPARRGGSRSASIR